MLKMAAIGLLMAILILISFKDKSIGLRQNCCGRQAVEPNLNYERIVSGIPVRRAHSWPWQVSLYGLEPESMYICGGAVISTNWILTAAHCFYPASLLHDPKVWSARAGEVYHNFFTKGVQVRRFEKIVTHEKHEWPKTPYDIALVKLSSPLNFNKMVQPICLPLPNYTPSKYMMCYVAGWPQVITKKEDPFHQITLPIIPHDVCTREDYYGKEVKETMLCAGWEDGGKDACKGDSGRPLMCLVNNSWTVVGVVSWGKKCGLPKQPGVFTNVPVVLDWIQAHIE